MKWKVLRFFNITIMALVVVILTNAFVDGEETWWRLAIAGLLLVDLFFTRKR